MVFDQRPQPPPPRDRAPVRDVVPRTFFPAFETVSLAQGRRAYLYAEPEHDLAHLLLLIPGGRRSDATAGLTELTFRMLLEGTRRRSGEELARELERLGARLSIRVGWDDVRVELTGLPTGWDAALGLLLEVLNQPSFPADALAREVQRTIQSVQAQRAEPGYLAERHFRRRLFGPHPYGRLEPDLADLPNLTTGALERAYRERIAARMQTWILAGGLDAGATLRRLEDGVADLPAAPAWSDPATPAVPENPQAVWVQRPGSVQTTVLLGVPLGAPRAEILPGVLVANAVLGGGASSRLFLTLREKRGYTYGAYSRLQSHRFQGFWLAATQVRAEAFPAAFRDLIDVLVAFREQGPGAAERAAAQRYLCGQFNIQHQSLQAVAQRLADGITWGLPADFWATYGTRIRAVDRDQIGAALQAWHRPWLVVCVGDLAASGGLDPAALPDLPGAFPWTVLEPDSDNDASN